MRAGIYTVAAGDTLQTIAQAAYGDSRLWLKIALANGVLGNNGLHDPSQVVSDTSHHLAVRPVQAVIA